MSKFTKGGLFEPPLIRGFEGWLNKSISYIKTVFCLPFVQIYLNNHGDSCYTNNTKIVVGGRFSLFNEVEEEKLPLLVQGIILHELSHILYTSFSTLKNAQTFILSGMLWPLPPDVPSNVLDYAKRGEHEANKVYSVYAQMVNILEDARIEYIAFNMLSQFNRFIKGLKLLRGVFRNSSPDIERLVSDYDAANSSGNEEQKAQVAMTSMLSLILDFARFGTVKGIDKNRKLSKHELVEDLAEVSDYINDAVLSTDAYEFMRNVNNVFSGIFDKYIMPYLETIPESDDTFGDSVGSGSRTVKKALGEISSKLPSSLEESEMDEETEKKTRSAKSEAKKELKGSKGSSENTVSSEVSENDPESKADKESTKRIPRIETDSIWEGVEGDGGVFVEGTLSEEGSFLDMDAIRRVAEDYGKATDEFDDSLEAPNIDYGPANKNVPIRIRRAEAYPGDVERMYESYSEYVKAGKKAAMLLKPQLEQEVKSNWQKNRYYGSRFDGRKASNPNLRHFSKKAAKPKTPTLSVAVLVDESGSMYGSKIEVARATAISLYEMCRELGINFAVYGHTTEMEPDCLIKNYCSFGSNKPDDKYRLLTIQAHRNNRDGAALRYTAEMLSRQNTDRKLLLVISDGQPAAYGYTGTAAEADIKQVIRDYKMKHVGIVAAAIDADKETIKGIYGAERFLSIDNLDSLATELLTVIRRVLFM